MSDDWQPKIRKSEVVLFSGMAVFFASFVLQMTVFTTPDNYYGPTPMPWVLVGGGIIGLVCFVIAMRSTD